MRFRPLPQASRKLPPRPAPTGAITRNQRHQHCISCQHRLEAQTTGSGERKCQFRPAGPRNAKNNMGGHFRPPFLARPATTPVPTAITGTQQQPTTQAMAAAISQKNGGSVAEITLSCAEKKKWSSFFLCFALLWFGLVWFGLLVVGQSTLTTHTHQRREEMIYAPPAMTAGGQSIFTTGNAISVQARLDNQGNNNRGSPARERTKPSGLRSRLRSRSRPRPQGKQRDACCARAGIEWQRGRGRGLTRP